LREETHHSFIGDILIMARIKFDLVSVALCKDFCNYKPLLLAIGVLFIVSIQTMKFNSALWLALGVPRLF